MSVVARAFVILFGLCVALACGFVCLLLAMLLEPSFARMLAYIATAGLDAAFGMALDAGRPEEIGHVLFQLWGLAVVLLAGPPTLAALIGEIARMSSYVWYAGGTGLLTAALPWIARGGAGSATPAELRVTLGLFLVGAASGFAYWLVAGRSAAGTPRQI